MKAFLPSPRLLLPLAIFIGVTIMGLRVADMLDMVESGRLAGTTAHAAPAKAAEAKPAESKPAEAKPAETKAADAKPAEAAKPDAKPTETASDDAASAIDADASPAEIEVLKQLAGRREQLEKRARDLDARETLIKVTEQRVDQKIKEMDTLRQQLQAMVTSANEAQQAQIDNLVKIYETMKPDEAAKIFETLDMPVLLGVIQKMKPARTAPIMAKMAPDKARDVTVALTKQDQLPQIK